MNTDNVWLRQRILRKAAKMIAHDFFPRPARKDIYSTCLAVGPEVLANYDRQEHGELWPWVFLNTLAMVNGTMCAMMILVVCQSEIPWQKDLAVECLQHRRNLSKESSTASTAKASKTPATSSALSSH